MNYDLSIKNLLIKGLRLVFTFYLFCLEDTSLYRIPLTC